MSRMTCPRPYPDPHHLPAHITSSSTGYMTAAAEKIFGSAFGSLLKHKVWTRRWRPAGKGRAEDPRPPKEKLPLSGLEGKHDWGPFPDSREQMATGRRRAGRRISWQAATPKPFFLGCGIVKPHTPWYVPKQYFDLFHLNKINIPDLAPDENAGLPDIIRVKDKLVRKEKNARRPPQGNGGGVSGSIALRR